MSRYTSLPPRQEEVAITDNMLSVSADGYIRLLFAEAQATCLMHMISGLDEDVPAHMSTSAMLTTITGYTEWISRGIPAISIGWDWQMDAIDHQIRLCRVSEPRSNVMLLDNNQADVGPEKTIALLEVFIDTLDWQRKVQDHIDAVYGR
ncbi:DUF4902 domain-containing protein [Paraherbaspirillum soli]|uniref:DUF4902 domain-containing protein n=1 Tax=Paraherbaspirillum soli TaxID=631222 RepID=A0ABW0M422_9BURK